MRASTSGLAIPTWKGVSTDAVQTTPATPIPVVPIWKMSVHSLTWNRGSGS